MIPVRVSLGIPYKISSGNLGFFYDTFKDFFRSYFGITQWGSSGIAPKMFLGIYLMLFDYLLESINKYFCGNFWIGTLCDSFKNYSGISFFVILYYSAWLFHEIRWEAFWFFNEFFLKFLQGSFWNSPTPNFHRKFLHKLLLRLFS